MLEYKDVIISFTLRTRECNAFKSFINQQLKVTLLINPNKAIIFLRGQQETPFGKPRKAFN
jgi:hypothetical protein